MATKNPASDINDQPEAKKAKLEDQGEVTAPSDEVNDQPEALNAAPADGNGTSASEPSKLERQIIYQVEYYFGDSNLFRDKFLQAEIQKNDGWVALSTLTTFKRLASLSTDIKQIVDALDKSDEGLLEISEDRQSVRRHPERPLPEKNEETRQEIISRTAYVKGFPKEMEMPECIEFFNSYPKVAHVVIRKYLDKPTKTYKSKGSVFVTFTTRDQCAAFLSQDVKYKETELITKWQSDYYANKKTERQEKQKEKNAKLEPEIELPKGTVLVISDIKSSETTRTGIKEAIEAMEAEVAFVEFREGNDKAHVRFTKKNGAKDFISKQENAKLKLGDDETTLTVLEGEEEEKYLNDCIEKMKLRRKSGPNNRKHNNRKRN